MSLSKCRQLVRPDRARHQAAAPGGGGGAGRGTKALGPLAPHPSLACTGLHLACTHPACLRAEDLMG